MDFSLSLVFIYATLFACAHLTRCERMFESKRIGWLANDISEWANERTNEQTNGCALLHSCQFYYFIPPPLWKWFAVATSNTIRSIQWTANIIELSQWNENDRLHCWAVVRERMFSSKANRPNWNSRTHFMNQVRTHTGIRTNERTKWNRKWKKNDREK